MSEIPSRQHREEVVDWQNIANIVHTGHPDLRVHLKRTIDQRHIPVHLGAYAAQSGRRCERGRY